MEMCLRVLKESNRSRFDNYSRQEQCIDHIPYYLSWLSRALFPTTFLEIAVYDFVEYGPILWDIVWLFAARKSWAFHKIYANCKYFMFIHDAWTLI